MQLKRDLDLVLIDAADPVGMVICCLGPCGTISQLPGLMLYRDRSNRQAKRPWIFFKGVLSTPVFMQIM